VSGTLPEHDEEEEEEGERDDEDDFQGLLAWQAEQIAREEQEARVVA
jgi:hypothetical protein